MTFPAVPRGVAALVLAGGQARRMGGGDKPLLAVGERAMLARILEAFGPLPAAISANGDPGRFAAFERPVIADGRFAGHGPLAGVLAGLEWAAGIGAHAMLSVPGDTPFVPADLAVSLVPPPACAASAGRTHPLVALWPVSCRPALHAWLSAPGSRAVAAFAASIGMRVVDFPVHDVDPFLNVNTFEELTEARARAAALPGSEATE